MTENKLSRLDMKLKKMLEDFYEAEDRRKHRRAPFGTGNVIRRRAGEKEKRFSARGR